MVMHSIGKDELDVHGKVAKEGSKHGMDGGCSREWRIDTRIGKENIPVADCGMGRMNFDPVGCCRGLWRESGPSGFCSRKHAPTVCFEGRCANDLAWVPVWKAPIEKRAIQGSHFPLDQTG